MKPVYITMKFFGSYKDVTIDFSKINNGIFLITGDTGAGKTTIFDAITYALYGESSGKKRDGKMMISQFAASNEFTEVIFCFRYGKDKYIVKRSPEQKRYKEKVDNNKNKIYKESSKKSTLELIMPDGSFFNDGKIEQKIKDIIGIDYKQFVQIAMLAQGDFLKLLHASSKDRQEIFAKIFDTSLYDMIQQELQNKYKNLDTMLENNKSEIKRLLSSIICSKESSLSEIWREKGRFSDDKASDILIFIQRIIDELNHLINKNEEDLIKCKQEQEKIQKLLNGAKQINEDFDELEQLEKDKERLLLKKKDIESIEKQYSNAERAMKVSESYNLYLDRKKDLDEKMREVNEYSIKVKECTDKREILSYEKLEADEKYNQEFEIKINEISLLESKMKEFDEIQKEQIQYQSELNKLKQKQNIQMDYKTKEDSAKKKVTILAKDIETLTEIAMKLDAIEKDLEQFNRDKKDLEELYSLLIKKEKLIKDLKEQKEQYNKTQKKRGDLENQYNQLYKEFINKQAYVLRKMLIEGEPCPVCGSKEHYIANVEEVEFISEQEVEKIKQKLDKSVKEENKNREQLISLESQQDENNKQINKYKNKYELYQDIETLEDVQTCIETTKAGIQKLNQQKLQALDAIKSLETAKMKLEADKKELEQIQSNKQQIDIDIAGIKALTSQMKKSLDIKEKNLPFATKKEAQDNLLEIKQYKDELEHNKKEKDTEYQEISEKMKALKEAYQLIVKERDKLIEREETAQQIFLDNLGKNKFLREDDFLNARMSDDEINQISDEITEYKQNVQRTDLKIELFLEKTKNKQRIDITKYNEEKKKIEDLTKRLQDEGKRIYADSKVNQQSYEDIKQQYKKREELKKKYILLKNLYDTANGKLSGKKINFQTYIQRRYFKQVIAAANVRFIKMTNNQFCLKCRDIKELGGQGNQYVGLDLDVYNIVSDQIRDVKTLSGGESFMASLCMALGLSDIIQNKAGKIQIQTMFIDEGFGTLSEEVRNQTLETLNELSNANILIGIISHVKELREQIDTKLIVTKTKDGSKAEWKT